MGVHTWEVRPTTNQKSKKLEDPLGGKPLRQARPKTSQPRGRSTYQDEQTRYLIIRWPEKGVNLPFGTSSLIGSRKSWVSERPSSSRRLFLASTWWSQKNRNNSGNRIVISLPRHSWNEGSCPTSRPPRVQVLADENGNFLLFSNLSNVVWPTSEKSVLKNKMLGVENAAATGDEAVLLCDVENHGGQPDFFRDNNLETVTMLFKKD